MKLCWGPRLSAALAVLSIGLHAGFYLTSYKGLFMRLMGATENLPIAIASWGVSKIFPACFPTLRQVVLFEALVPVLAAAQGFVVGLTIDALNKLRVSKSIDG